MAKTITQWLVEPLDDWTNQKVATFLIESQGNEDMVICNDSSGKPHNLWLIPDYAKLCVLNKSATGTGLRYKVYERHTPNGFVYLAPIWAQPQKRKKRRLEVLQTATRLLH
ncbi:MAG: hypothetical protein A2418_00335 [Candidatus Brennerbacteria bacterium RIFOXYC1_FULL_41_11]|uniref:Uncharacterized protein n=1 Tax=Candidatus Brennerbacteria bacterium RIFOXYD1_FULL_41_16 TaxID=1797529 RepID=A0A1G1XJX6_9BACT|nr:MAG: hypothetical protein A2391_01795 [Candidatus Brennerbacteria bacterium RIFOXYB1_FULL_41_13]OGY39684.1 MAG: hypothetical protein A2418_00335 [Candidatus Brennerbacteria bacterium RIFOXYC1_FULL_41_11]OGY40308.1 MAG: hypothetical protein A2570_03460 [Candidatus Brennerbacteria bacterium RIFOXYD1_FULL_41_16]